MSVVAADHGISGYDAQFKPVTGYYRRILELMHDKNYDAHDVCNDK